MFKELTLKQFVNIQGITQMHKNVMLRNYKNEPTHTYNEWYQLLGKNFPLSPMKCFANNSGLGVENL